MLQNINKVFGLSWYMFLSTLRNPSAIFFSLAFPVIFISLFGGLNFGSDKRTVVIEPDSIKTGVVYETLKQIQIVKLEESKSAQEIQTGLERGQLSASVKITENQGVYSVVVRTSEAEPVGSSAVVQIMKGVEDAINRQANPIVNPVVISTTEQVKGREYKQIDFILPGQLGFALLGTAVFGMAFSLINLRQTLVLKRMFATPTPKWLILLAQALSRLYQAWITTTVLIGAGVFAFGFTLLHGFWTYLAMMALASIAILVFLSFGLLAAAFAKNDSGADPITNIITLPQFILSGAFFTTEAFPGWLLACRKSFP